MNILSKTSRLQTNRALLLNLLTLRWYLSSSFKSLEYPKLKSHELNFANELMSTELRLLNGNLQGA